MPIKMKSLKSHRYGTRQMQAGEEYEVPGESMARVVTALSWAQRASAAPTVVTPSAQPTAAVLPQAVALPEAAAPAPRAAKTTSRARWGRPVADVEVNLAEPAEPTEPRDHGLVGSVESLGDPEN